MFSEHMLDKRMFGDLVNPDKLILQGTENLNFTEWTEMNLKLNIMSENDIAEFKKNVQCAFQKGFKDVFGKREETILPEKDIDQSLNGKGSVAYKAVLDGETVGGVIVAIDTVTQHNHLDLLYVKSDVQ